MFVGISEIRGGINEMRSFWTTISLASLLALPFSQPADADVIAFGSGGNTFNMEFVAMGDAGNADDTGGGIRIQRVRWRMRITWGSMKSART